MFFTSSFSQERYGISNSPNAGITGSLLNPASMASSPYRWDLNIVTAHSYFDNNYFYLYPARIPKLIANIGSATISVNTAWNSSEIKRSKYILKNKTHNSWRKCFYSSVLVQGPSLMFNIKRWTFGVETAVREAASLTRLHKDIVKLIFEEIDFDSFQEFDIANFNITIPKFRVNAIAWGEIGFSVAREIKRIDRDTYVKAGLTLKHINAFAGIYFLNKEIQMIIPNDSDMYFKNVNLKYGYAFNENMNNTNFFVPEGKGKSMDVGITIEKKSLKNKYQCPNFCKRKLELQYSWKLGISLIDIGYVHFNKDAKTFLIENRSNYWFNLFKLKANGIEAIDSTMNAHFGDNQTPIFSGTSFTMLLPWAASIQYDYNIGYDFYVNGTWVQRIPHFGLPGVDRVNSIAITPRYEGNRIGIAMPIALYNYIWPKIGFALRINNCFIIGTDKLGAFLDHRISGEDIYVALKINVLRKCDTKKKKKTAPSF